jgi:hypothetical protein
MELWRHLHIFEVYKSTKCQGTLKAMGRLSLMKCENEGTEKLLEEINT